MRIKSNIHWPPCVLKTIFISLIQCNLNYGILVWGHLTTRIFKLQKRAVRTITGSNYIAHTERLFRNLEVLNINDIKMQQLKFYYRLRNMQLPTYFYNMPLDTNYQLHKLNTRSSSNLHIIIVNREFAKNVLDLT